MVFSCFGGRFRLRRRRKPQKQPLPPAQDENEIADDDSQTSSAASEWINTTQDIFASYATMDTEVRFAWLRAQLEDIHDLSSDGDNTTDKSRSHGASPDAIKTANKKSAEELESNAHKAGHQELVARHA